jgi:hypothetical protein
MRSNSTSPIKHGFDHPDTGARRRSHIDAVFDRVFGARDNPLRHLGALGFYFFWVMAVSGIYLYAFYDTGVTDAYSSVERLTHDQWFLGE